MNILAPVFLVYISSAGMSTVPFADMDVCRHAKDDLVDAEIVSEDVVQCIYSDSATRNKDFKKGIE